MGFLGGIVLPTERRLKIVDEVLDSGVVSAESLAELFGVSLETVRRDLRDLELQGLLQRVYGGATAPDVRATEGDFEQRRFLYEDRKFAIAAKAAQLVKPNETIFIDMGTTCLEFARALPHSWSGRVLTNSLLVAAALAQRPTVSILLTGGEVRGGDLTCSGPFGAALHELFYVARAFVGAGGVDPVAGLTDYHLGEGALRRRWLEESATFYVLADSSKLGVIAPFKIAPLAALTAIVTDDLENGDVVERIRASGADVIVGSPATKEPVARKASRQANHSRSIYTRGKNMASARSKKEHS